MDSNGLRFGWGQDDNIALDGFLDDYRIYGRALSASEVRAFSQ